MRGGRRRPDRSDGSRRGSRCRECRAVDRLLLARRDLALDIGELGVGGEKLPQPTAVEVGEDGGEQLRRLVGIDHVARLGEERGGADVGRERLPVAVDDVGARLRGGADEARAVVLLAMRGDAEQHEPRGKHAVERRRSRASPARRGSGRGAPDRRSALHCCGALVPPDRGGNDRGHCAASRVSSPEFSRIAESAAASSGAGPVGRIGRFSILVIWTGSSGCSFRSSA